MTKTNRFLFAIASLLLGILAVQPAVAQTGRQVYAFYFGWYSNDSWNDGTLLDRPATLYSSFDANAVGHQVDQARGAGIDAFIMDWYGPQSNNMTNQVFSILLNQSSIYGFHAGVALDLGDPNFNATAGDTVASLQYLVTQLTVHPAYLRWGGQPVIYFWNENRFSAATWQSIRAQVDPNRSTIWVAEGTNTAFLPTFDGLYLFNTAWSANPGATAAQYLNQTVAAGGWFYTPTVMPGWDESHVTGRGNPTATQDRAGGAFLTNSWNGAVSSSASVILIVSWNEYYENSHIEPSQLYGTTALDTLRSLITTWKGYAPQPTVEQLNAPVVSPTGVTYRTTFYLRLRSGPSTDDDVIDNLPLHITVAVIGRSADGGWLQVNYNGGSGWVSAGYGVVTGDLSAVPVSG
jgi:uncharacterized protein YgiM (DUF1202 family)